VARLIGAPPGYVGMKRGVSHGSRAPQALLRDPAGRGGEGGIRTFRRALAGADDGRLTDGQGRTVNFKNSVIVRTSTSVPGDPGDEWRTELREDEGQGDGDRGAGTSVPSSSTAWTRPWCSTP